MATTETYVEVVRDLEAAGLVTVAEDGAVDIVPHDLDSVVAIIKQLGAAHRARNPREET
jgi:hypothetical protein